MSLRKKLFRKVCCLVEEVCWWENECGDGWMHAVMVVVLRHGGGDEVQEAMHVVILFLWSGYSKVLKRMIPNIKIKTSFCKRKTYLRALFPFSVDSSFFFSALLNVFSFSLFLSVFFSKSSLLTNIFLLFSFFLIDISFFKKSVVQF